MNATTRATVVCQRTERWQAEVKSRAARRLHDYVSGYSGSNVSLWFDDRSVLNVRGPGRELPSAIRALKRVGYSLLVALYSQDGKHGSATLTSADNGVDASKL